MKGGKDYLSEGGTLSPAFIYSTKNNLPNREVSNLIHISDWFPTILRFAKAPIMAIPTGLDGVNQMVNFIKPVGSFKPKRNRMIYGIVEVEVRVFRSNIFMDLTTH